MNNNQIKEDNAAEAEEEYVRPDDKTILNETVNEKLRLMFEFPGLEVEFDPEEAELAGFFIDNAMSAEDAMDAVYDEYPHGKDS